MIMFATFAVAAPAQPDEGMGKLIGLCIAIGIAYLVITTHQRYRTSDDSDADTSPPPKRSARKPLPRGVSQPHVTVDNVFDQPRWKNADSRDSSPSRSDSAARKGRQRDDSPRLSLADKARNVFRTGSTQPIDEAETADEPDVEPSDDDAPALVQAYAPPAPPAVEPVIDLALEDQPAEADKFAPGGAEPLRDYVNRLDLERVAFKEIVAAVAEHYGKSEATTARALRQARAGRQEQP